jgi:phage shock protein A
VNANINALLEKAEEPEKIIRLMIQEMEDTLVEIRSAAAKCIAEKKEHRRQISRLEDEQAEWQQKAELALSKNREDLARAALVEKAAVSDRTAAMQAELEIIDRQLDKFNSDISQLQSKLQDAKLRQRSIIMRHKTATSQLRARKHIHDANLEDMMFRFEAAEQRIDRVESEAEVLDIGRKRSLADEIDDLQNDERVDEELRSLKSKVGKSSKAKTAKSEQPKQESDNA